MSAYTMDQLNDGRILAGMGHVPWWYEDGHTTRDGEPVLYDGPVPVADVKRRLFPWQAVAVPVTYELPDGRTFTDASRNVIARDDTGALLGVFTDNYVPHQYDETLLNGLETLVQESGGDLKIEAAGELADGAEAWVSIVADKSYFNHEGVDARPHILAATSLNGKIATTFANVVTLAICDNTRAAALGEKGRKFKIKHTKFSADKVFPSAREALDLIAQTADVFAAEINNLLSLSVSELQWAAFLDAYAPHPGSDASKRAQTVAETKREALTGMYNSDPRVTPWHGTAFGALQAVNTFETHVLATRGNTSRADRNVRDAIVGKLDDREADNRSKLLSVLA